ncbi:MAG: DUF4384 domain-containing protein [Leptospiraceae bacterium]|nr:DUF4384 domain-containing protein [Leptospiraceae bacterium]MCP5498738.1 DUF4384 domain-containing protein [Leptospiraceae bacterium]
MKPLKNSLYLVIFLFLFLAISIPADEPLVLLKTGRENYYFKDPIKFNVFLHEKSYLYIVNLRSNGEMHLLYPNEFEENNLLEKGNYSIPSEKDDYFFYAGEPEGKEILFALVSRTPVQKLQKKLHYKNPIVKQKAGSNLSTTLLNWLTSELPYGDWDLSEVHIRVYKNRVKE